MSHQSTRDLSCSAFAFLVLFILSAGGLFAGGIMEGGSTTGIAISFDTWSGNTYSDGGDIEGILVRVDFP